jgi:alpha,alpha-trehalase
MDLKPALSYIEDYWPRLIRFNPRQQATLIGLPKPYLVPSDGSMFQEMYYWDSFFMGLGVLGTSHEDLVIDMAGNMAFLFEHFDVIPNGNRYYFLSRSQPPLFTQMIWLAFDVKRRRGDTDADSFLRRLMRIAEQEHETVWMGIEQPHHRQVFDGLSRYFDINYLDALASCESGWDHSTRCDDRWLEHLPVDLNSILYLREMDFARAAEQLHRPSRAESWRERAAKRAETMHELMWDDGSGFFFDYDWVHHLRNPHSSVAGFFPMWAGLATQEQADRMVKDWLPKFEFPGGLVTSTEEREGRQWAYPNGWAPLQWIVTNGLERYGFQEEADRIRRKWCELGERIFEATGTMWEKYNVVEVESHPEKGLYGSIAGFGWTNGVFVDFARRLAEKPSDALAEPSTAG